MPPDSGAAEGREEMFKLWVEAGFGSERFGRLHCVVTHANLQPAVAAYVCRPGDSTLAGHGAGCSSNRGRLDHGDRGVPAGHFPDSSGCRLLMDPAPEMNASH